MQANLAQLPRNGLAEQLAVAFGVGLLDHLAPCVELRSGSGAFARLQQQLAIHYRLRPVGQRQVIQKTPCLLQRCAVHCELGKQLRASRIIVTDQLPALVVIRQGLITCAITETLRTNRLAIHRLLKHRYRAQL
ncbi:hypothetical protein D3C76_1364240 [compost metagenome]